MTSLSKTRKSSSDTTEFQSSEIETPDISVEKVQSCSLKHRPLFKAALLVLLAMGVIGAGASHTLCAQPFKNDLGIKNLSAPWFFTIVTMMSFPLPVIAWLITTGGKFQIPNFRSRMLNFLLLAFLDAANTGFGSVGLDIMSAASYSICRGACLVFTMILSLLLTKKKFNKWHYSGVFLMCLAVLVTALASDDTGREHQATVSQTVWATTACLMSSFFVALLSVLTQKLFADENTKFDLEFICQLQAFQSMFSFFMTLPILFMFDEWREWPSMLEGIRSSGHMLNFVWLTIGMFISRPLMLFSNIGATSLSSATYVRCLGGPRRLFIIVVAWLVQNQIPNNSILFAALAMTLSLAVYVYGGVILKRAKKTMRLSEPIEASALKNVRTLR